MQWPRKNVVNISKPLKAHWEAENCIPLALKEYITLIRETRKLKKIPDSYLVPEENRIILRGDVSGWSRFWNIHETTEGEIFCDLLKFSFEIGGPDLESLVSKFEDQPIEQKVRAFHVGPLPSLSSEDFKGLLSVVDRISCPHHIMLTWCTLKDSVQILGLLLNHFGQDNVQHVVWTDSKFPRGYFIVNVLF